MNVPVNSIALPAPALPRRTEFFANHLVFPVAALLLLSMLLMAGDGDQWLADHLFRLQGGHWALKDAWLTSRLIHHDGKMLSVAASVAVIAALLGSCYTEQWHRYRRPLLYLLLAVALSTGLVSMLKSITHMDCPWDLSRYGGVRAFVGLFDPRPADMARASCFPGGHSSAGYGWIGLYFFALVVRPAWRWRALTLSLLVGAIFGIGQQLRGAHFLSHDLWSLGICWLVALALYLLMFPGHVSQRASGISSVVTSGETA